jgi:hypothetical protein
MVVLVRDYMLPGNARPTQGSTVTAVRTHRPLTKLNSVTEPLSS